MHHRYGRIQTACSVSSLDLRQCIAMCVKPARQLEQFTNENWEKEIGKKARVFLCLRLTCISTSYICIQIKDGQAENATVNTRPSLSYYL